MYWEDVDLSHRWLRQGGDLRVVHEVSVVHDVGGTQGAGGKSPLYGRQMCKNRLRFATLHVAPAVRLRWLWHTPRYAARVVTRDGRRGALRNPRLVASAVWGSLVGVGLVLRSLVRDALTRAA
jgi:GT2 family glycosyltransferase